MELKAEKIKKVCTWEVGQMIVGALLLVSLFFLVGFIAARKAEDQFLFLKAGVYFIIMEVTSSIALIISVAVAYFSIVHVLGYAVNIFNFGIIVTLIGGILNFYVIKGLHLFHQANGLLITLVEYYIQWTTIFLTLYQVLTKSGDSVQELVKLGLSDQVVDINILNFLVLPLLLVSWISIAMIKIYLTELSDH